MGVVVKKRTLAWLVGTWGIARVNHEGNAEGLPRLAGEFGAVRGGRRRERGAADVREADAGFFEDGAVGKDAGAPAAAFGAGPIVRAKFRGAVYLFERGAEVGLQAEEIGADGGDVGRGRGKHGRSDLKRRMGTASENENDFGAGSDATRAARPQRESPAVKVEGGA